MALYAPAAAAQASATGASSKPSQPKAQTPPGTPAQPESPLKDEKAKFSYALGMRVGDNLRKQSVDVDTNLLMQGLKDALSGGRTLMTDQEAQAAITQMQNDLRAKQEERAKLAAVKNKEQGEAFLEANKSKPGVVTLPSGLQYKILVEGTGPKPRAVDKVVCHYRGTLIDGTEFDSSYKRGEPVTFPVSGVIKGWTEALQLMPVGSKWQLFIPAGLAYGERSPGPEIGPNSTLIFEVELISIEGQH
jgi:FKBP-type peptidyl-prolyl cis-trans isomerase